MDTRKDFSPASPGEREAYSFNFVRDLNDVDELQSASFTLAVEKTDPGVDTDPDPSSHLDGAASVGPDSEQEDDERDLIASQWIEGLEPGNTYRVECAALTTAGATKILWGLVYCEPLGRTVI